MYYGIYVYIDPPNHPNAYIPYMERLGYTQILLVLCPKMDPDPWLRWPAPISIPSLAPTQPRTDDVLKLLEQVPSSEPMRDGSSTAGAPKMRVVNCYEVADFLLVCVCGLLRCLVYCWWLV